ncbi:MAG: diguanylate cyclase domain-containing protein [Elainellaceae cyanobacterium]
MVSIYPHPAVSMTSLRQQLYPTLRAIAQEASTLDLLLRQTLSLLAGTHRAEGALWVERQSTLTGVGRAYITAAASRWCDLGDASAKALQAVGGDCPTLHHPLYNSADAPSPSASASGGAGLPPVRRFRPQALPQWLVQQQRSPQTIQLANGNLIVPVLSLGSSQASLASLGNIQGASPGTDSSPPVLQFVLQLHRPPSAKSQTSDGTPHGWSAEEVASLEAVASQILLLCDSARLRYSLDQSQRHAALVGRISHLLNSVLSPDDVVRRILAELGQTIRCDRCLIVDLRHDEANVLSLWNRPRQPLRPLDLTHHTPALWREAVDLVLQGAASYLELDLPEGSEKVASKVASNGAIAANGSPSKSGFDSLEGWLAACGARSALTVPIFIQEEYFGMIVLLSHRSDRAYQVDELQMIGRVADQVAIALKTARHYPIAAVHANLLKRSHVLRPLNDLEDRLTLLLTRPSLEQELEQLSTKAMQATHDPFSIALCDLDYFKLINDTYGAAVGDEVLKHLAEKMQRYLRRGTPLYRYGGEEFAVLLPETVLPEAVNVAERLRRLIRSQAVTTTAGGLEVTVSFGVAQQDVTRDTCAEDVLRRAEAALANAKRQGRDRVEAIAPVNGPSQ